MCGISGRFNLDGRPVSAVEVASMRDVMKHRGPDDSGLFIDGNIGLGHRRLSIIDLSGGHQPLSNEDGQVTVVFNGEIYNFKDLQADLRSRGHTLRTRSDTEVIVHSYEDLGAECVQRFRGMFAFAVWDARERRLVLARDRLGIKPLYYAVSGKTLLFASEIKSLLDSDVLRAEIDPVGLRRYLAYRSPYGHGTMFAGIKQVPPGHYLLADANGIRVQSYWQVPTRDEGRRASADEFLPILERAVELRMISDVPIGVFLSGGLDSSAITALMAKRTSDLKSFSIGFVPGEESELAWARKVADACGAHHHEFVQGSEDFFGLLRTLVWNHDEPLTFPASIPLYLLSRESKREATVMLAGEGADELLAGYGNNIRAYWLARWRRMLPRGAWRLAARMAVPSRLRTVAGRLSADTISFIAGWFRLSDAVALSDACRVELPDAEADDRALFAEIGADARRGSFLDRLLYFQLRTYLVALLMKQDKMSMAASIESRVPYLDHHLVELAFTLPDDAKIRGKVGKALLRQVSQRLLPDDVIRRPKQGFPVPIAQWFRAQGNPFLEVLLDPASLRDGLLDGAYVRRRVEHFLRGANTSTEIWAMLNLELWRRQFLIGRTASRASA